MRKAFLGGFGGQLTAGLIWAGSAALATWSKPLYAMGFLFFGSMLLFPLTRLVMRLLGRPGKVSPENHLWALGMQTAFTVPINFLLVGAATLYNPDWFFPAAMIAVGAHYLPFITLYGMKLFGFLAALLVGGGTALVFLPTASYRLGGWISAAAFILFAFLGRALVIKEETGG